MTEKAIIQIKIDQCRSHLYEALKLTTELDKTLNNLEKTLREIPE